MRDRLVITPSVLSQEYIEHKEEVDEAIQRVLRSGTYVNGPETEAFEEEFAKYVGTKYCIAVGSGYDALYLSYRVLKSKRVHVDRELHISTTNAALAAGAVVNNSGLYDTIVGVYHPGDACTISCDILDACQYIGTGENIIMTREPKLICFSFHPLKVLHCYGDGGAICTNNEKLNYELRILRNHGRVPNTGIYYEGVNSRLDEIQAAVLRVFLAKLKKGEL